MTPAPFSAEQLEEQARQFDGWRTVFGEPNSVLPLNDTAAMLRQAAAQARALAAAPPADEILAKARKLLEALVEPCNVPPNAPDGDHAWRLCRRCLALAQFDSTPDVTRILVQRVLDHLPLPAPPSTPPGGQEP